MSSLKAFDSFFISPSPTPQCVWHIIAIKDVIMKIWIVLRNDNIVFSEIILHEYFHNCWRTYKSLSLQVYHFRYDRTIIHRNDYEIHVQCVLVIYYQTAIIGGLMNSLYALL